MSRKIFISHCHKDKKYVDEFVTLLKTFGFGKKDIFYSSSFTMGVDPGQIIFERLKEELKNKPVVLYFLSENYYQSIPCLNEMGASWIVTEKHYPIALPGFSPSQIKGAINNDRLAICLNKDTKAKEVFNIVKKICFDANIVFPDDVEMEPIKYILPFCETIKKLIRWEECLLPNDKGEFEAVLGKERILPNSVNKKYICFELSHLIHPQSLKLDDLPDKDVHCLFFNKEEIAFKEGDKVLFDLNEKKSFEEKKFKGSQFKNIFPEKIKKLN